MNCQEVSTLLVVYLDGEVTPSERTLLQAHLTGCHACQERLAELSALQSHLSRSLHLIAAEAAPPPDAWDFVQAGLASSSGSKLLMWLQRLAPGVDSTYLALQGGVKMKRGFAFVALGVALVAVTLGTVAFVPAARARASELLSIWFRFESPFGDGEAGMSGPIGFIPLRPTYLPPDLQMGGSSIGGIEPETLELTYYREQQFVAITQSKAPADATLPAGRDVSINGQPAVLIDGLTGTFSPFGSAEIAYTEGRRLIWYVGETRIEMLSNLSEEEMLKIAASMAPAPSQEGEPPVVPPPPPSGDQGEGMTGGGSLESNP